MQLHFRTMKRKSSSVILVRAFSASLVERVGFEPTTYGLEGVEVNFN